MFNTWIPSSEDALRCLIRYKRIIVYNILYISEIFQLFSEQHELLPNKLQGICLGETRYWISASALKVILVKWWPLHFGRWHISQLSLAVWLMKVQCWQVQEVAAAEDCVLGPPAPTTSVPRPPVKPSAPEAITSCSTVAHCPDCFHSSAAARLCVLTASSNGPMYSWKGKVTLRHMNHHPLTLTVRSVSYCISDIY